jgi:hypothetical protein
MAIKSRTYEGGSLASVRHEVTRTKPRQRDLTGHNWKRAIGLLGLCLSAGAALLGGADCHARKRPGATAQTVPSVLAKIYRRPLLRPARIQFCLKERGLYQGRITATMSKATERGLIRLRDELQIEADDVAQDWALHAVLWRGCRQSWMDAGGTLDRFGFAVAAAKMAALPQAEQGPPARPNLGAPYVIANAPPPLAPAMTDSTPVCLSADLRDIMARAQGRRSEIPACEAPCLPQPAEMNADDAEAYERRLGFKWCKPCVVHAGDMRLDDILRLETASGLTLCPDPRRLIRIKPGGSGTVVVGSLRGTRALFRTDVSQSLPHDGFAVVISVSGYGNGLPTWPRAERDAAGIQALLVERLGFRSERVIELKNPTRAELEGVLGRSNGSKGLLADRLKDAAGSPVLIYFSGLGAISNNDKEAYLLPVDAVPKREFATGYPVEALYRHAGRLGAGPVTIVIEADFTSDPNGPVVSPNAPETRGSVLPRLAVRNLTVFTASERDQRPLEDGEFGLSLFTRHLIAGLSGHADAAPLGNGDGTVDTSEAFVYAAQRTIFAARKLAGVLQRPLISQGRSLPINRVGVLAR